MRSALMRARSPQVRLRLAALTEPAWVLEEREGLSKDALSG